MKDFFRTLPRNIISSFKGKNIYLHFLAIILTIAIVRTGFDWLYFSSTQSWLIQILSFPAIAMGGFMPFLVPGLFLIVGKIRKDAWITLNGWAIAQAAAIGWLVSSAYKVFTGRVQPDLSNVFVDISHQFLFGFFRHGIFWGWPSSHTTVAFAMAVALITLHPKVRSLRYEALIYALYIGLGVSVNIHWFSEFVAGALIGTAVGLAVGRSFLHRFKQ